MTKSPVLDLVLPPSAARSLPPDPRETALRELYSYPVMPENGYRIRANMVCSLDGAAWGPDHRSGSINNAADLRLFEVLRSVCDLVLIGAGTAHAEGYGQLRTSQALGGTVLPVAVVSASGSIPATLRGGEQPAWVLTVEEGAHAAASAVGHERTIVATAESGVVDLAEAMNRLAEKGYRRILCEGGPTLLGALLSAGLVDELCLTTTPRIIGPEPGRIVAGFPALSGPHNAIAARLVHLLHSEGTLLSRWLLK